MPQFDDTQTAFKGMSNTDLQRSRWMFMIIGIQWLTRLGGPLLQLAVIMRLPVLGIIKATIFRQFCGGVSIADARSTIAHLGKDHVKTILDYSAEGKSREVDFDRTANELLATVQEAKINPDIPFAVFKVTGLARLELLEKVSESGPLSSNEKDEWAKVRRRVENICQAGADAGVPVLIDAEETWIQKAIDDLAMEMIAKHNTQGTIIFNTLQLYRHDRLAYLKQVCRETQESGLHLGFKLVRGAYMEKERARAKKMGYTSPIQATKEDTDRDFDLAVEFCVENVNRVSLCCGSHNEQSSTLLTELMEKNGIAHDDSRISFAQLLGMSNHISYILASKGYNVGKYVPYGPVRDVIPYLIRRAAENTSVAGQTGRELNLITKERQRRALEPSSHRSLA